MKIRSINLTLFLIVFFLMMGFFNTLAPFGGGDYFKTSSEVLSGDNSSVNTNVSSYVEGTLREAAQGQMDEYREGDIGSIFSFMVLGAKVLISVFASTLRYIVFFADVLIAWGTPFLVAFLVQMMVYITYALTIYEAFVRK